MKTLIDYIKESEVTKYDKYDIITYYPKEDENDLLFLKTNKYSIYKFLDDGYVYAKLGKFKGCDNVRSLIKNSSCLRIGYYNDEMIAIGVYTNYKQGYKAVGYTVTTNLDYRDLGILCLHDIIKLDINTSDKYFWTMCSGAIKHLWHKLGGVMIPNIFLKEYVGDKRKTEKSNDGFEFKIYDDNDDWDIKVIFGYNSKETFDKINEQLENYVFTHIDDSINEKFNDKDYAEDLRRKLASFIDMIDFDGIVEMPEKCIDYLKTLVEEAEKLLETYKENKILYHNMISCKESLEILKPLQMNEMK